MNSGSKEQKGLAKCIILRDFFSELPDEVIVHILSFLPTLDAVRTVLLRRFGNLWTLVPNIEFCDEWDEIESPFSRFVENVLILHKRPTIDKLLLSLSAYTSWGDNIEAEMEEMIAFALSREAKAVTLVFDPEEQFPFLSSSIYTSQSLVMLKLHNCRIELPSRAHMGSLRTLEIVNVSVEDNFSELLCGCPCLQELVIDHAEDIAVVSSLTIQKLVFTDEDPKVVCTIDCPNLKTLHLSVHLEYVEVVVPSVREVTVRPYEYEDDACEFKSFLRFLEGVQNAEVLTFTSEVDQQLTYCSMENVGFPKTRWKRVVLKSSLHDMCIAGICSLVRNSPCLEELTIHEGYSMVEIKSVHKMVSQETSSPCVVPHLKVVSMYGHRNPYEGQLRLAEFLLKNAVNLDKLVIFPNRWRPELTIAEELQFVKELSNFPRTSAKARIVFE